MKVYTISIALIVSLAIALNIVAPLVSAEGIAKIYAVIEPAKDGVYLSLNGIIEQKKVKTGFEGFLRLYIETRMSSAKRMHAVKYVLENIKSIERPTSGKEIQIVGPLVISSKLVESVIKGYSDIERGKSEQWIDGELKFVNGTVRVHAHGVAQYVGKEEVYTVNATYVTPVKIVHPDALSQLPLVEKMFTPEALNLQYAMLNITWVKVEEAEMKHKIENDTLIVEMHIKQRTDFEKFIESFSKRRTELPQSIAKLRREILLKLRALPEGVSISEVLYAKNRILENESKVYVYLQHGIVIFGREDYVEEYTKVYIANIRNSMLLLAPSLGVSLFPCPSCIAAMNLSTKVIKALSPWLNISLLPSNASAYLEVSATSDKVRVEVSVQRLRLGHLELVGAEATREVAKLIVSLLEGFKAAGFDVDYVCTVPGCRLSKELIDKSRDLVAELKDSLGIEVAVKPRPTATPITTMVFKTLTITKTLPITVTISKTVEKSVTVPTTMFRTIEKTYTLTKTALKTVAKTETYRVTETKVLTSTVTSAKVVTTTETTTKVVEKGMSLTTFIAIEVVTILVVAIAVYLLKR